jgi:hypothetical protein
VFRLKLSGTPITDAGLKELKDLSNLAQLELRKTAVTDQGVKELKGFKNLRHLDLGETKITDAGLKELRTALPRCGIRKPNAKRAPRRKRAGADKKLDVH